MTKQSLGNYLLTKTKLNDHIEIYKNKCLVACCVVDDDGLFIKRLPVELLCSESHTYRVSKMTIKYSCKDKEWVENARLIILVLTESK